MEVYHHPHIDSDSHRKKGFKEYIVEFVIIFLAVTPGFIAKSLRENISNHAKEKEYIASMIEDTQTDGPHIRLAIAINLIQTLQKNIFKRAIK